MNRVNVRLQNHNVQRIETVGFGISHLADPDKLRDWILQRAGGTGLWQTLQVRRYASSGGAPWAYVFTYGVDARWSNPIDVTRLGELLAQFEEDLNRALEQRALLATLAGAT